MTAGEGLDFRAWRVSPGAGVAGPGAVVALAASAALALAAAPASAQVAPPPAAPGATTPPEAEDRPAESPATPAADSPEGPQQPVGPEPIGPVRTFEPVPIPEGMAPPGVRTTPYEPGSQTPTSPAGPAAVDTRPGARSTPVVPGAAEAGFVVVDPQRVFGADALPAVGASVVQASGFTLSASLNARYDDNFLRLEGDLPPGTPGSKSEVLITPLANVGFGRQVNRQFFFFASSVGRTLLLRNEDRDTDRVSVNGGWDWRAGASCSGRVSGGWSTNEVRATDQLVRTNSVNKSTNLFTSASCNLPNRLVPSVSAFLGQNRFERGLLGIDNLSDSEFWGITPSLGYAFSARGQAGVQASYQSASFPNQPLDPNLFPPGEAPPPGSVNGVESLGISGFITYQLSRRISANATFGYTKTKSRNPLVDDFSGWTGSFGLSYADLRWGASLSASRGVSLGQDALSNFVVESVINGVVTYRLRPRVGLSTGFDLANTDRRGAGGGVIGGLVGFEDRSRRGFFGTDLTLTERIVVSFDYLHEVREIEVIDFKTNSDQVAGTLRFAFR